MKRRHVAPEEVDRLIGSAQRVLWVHGGREYEGVLTKKASQPDMVRFSGDCKSEHVEANVSLRDLLVEEPERTEEAHGSMVR